MFVSLFANIFPSPLGCFLILFMVSFAVQKLLTLIGFHLFIFTFISVALGDRLNISTIYVTECFAYVLLGVLRYHFFYLKNAILSLLLCVERVCVLTSLIYMWLSSFPNTTYWKRLCFLHCIFLPPLSD